MIVGEIALLRDAPRTATVVRTEELSGWVGGHEAFAALLDVPGMLGQIGATARQRLAAFITPIPVRMRDGTRAVPAAGAAGRQRAHHARARRVLGTRSTAVSRRRRRPTKSLMTYLFEVDYIDHFVWVMTDGDDGPVVADARFVRDEADQTIAEVAFIVGDDYQGRGVGAFLMAAWPSWRAGRVRRFTARVLAENTRCAQSSTG